MARLIFLGAVNYLQQGVLIRMGALIGIGELIFQNTFKGDAYLKGRVYWKEGAKLNHYCK